VARFVVRRVVQACVVLLFVSIFTFLIFQVIPDGTPALRLAGKSATPQTIAAVVRQWGFNKPIWVQYADMMGRIFSGSVISYSEHVNVLQQIERGLPATLSLAIGAGLIWFVFAVVVGALSAVRAGHLSDRFLTLLSLTAISTPTFVVGAVALYFLSWKVHIFPLSGYVPLSQSVGQWFMHLVLPWLSLSVVYIGLYSRVLRSTMLDNMHEDYVRTARAKGLSERKVLIRHVLRTSLIPIVSMWGLDFAGVIGGGAILVEVVFNLDGVGQYAAESIQTLDVPPLLVIVMYGAVLVVVIAALVDILYVWLDPRVRLEA
jgi:peptide/nickel transport system permease protein